MAEVITSIATVLSDFYNELIGLLPNWLQQFVSLFGIVLIILLYSIFIWKFYRFISRKNIIGLNLSQYNKTQHPVLDKILAGVLYFVEYIIILPFLIFFWFAIFSLFLMFLTEGTSTANILIFSATVIAAIRMAAYYREALAQDLAKMLPFTLLAVSIVNPDLLLTGSRIFTYVTEISGFFDSIFIYLVFIVAIEIILRFFEFIFAVLGLTDEHQLNTKQPEPN